METASHIPALISGTLYLTGTAIYVSICAWLRSMLTGDDRQILLRVYVKKYVWRALCVGVFVSACMVLYTGRILEDGIITILPETVFFALLSGFYIIPRRRLGKDWGEVLRDLFVVESGKTMGLVLACVTVWGFSFSIGKGSLVLFKWLNPSGDLDGFAVFMVIGFWGILPLIIVNRVKRSRQTHLSMRVIIWPMLLSVLCLICPLLLEVLAENIESGRWVSIAPLEKT